MRALVFGALTAVAIAGAGSAVWAARSREAAAPIDPRATPVIVELFSSEGCSSCPPADAWLASVDRTQPIDGVGIVVIEEHVDYWDGLGWRDPFAKAGFDERQRAYAAALSDHGVYTPEIVVDGRATVGPSDLATASRVAHAAASEARARVAIARDADRVTIDAREIPVANDDPAEIFLAITESGLASDVARGENAGRRLAHAPIARSIVRIGTTRGDAFHGEARVAIDPSWSRSALRFVAFVSRARTRKIVGAGVLAGE